MTRRPKPIAEEPPWMRLGPAADAPDEGDDGERLWKKIAEGVKPLKETKRKRHVPPSPLDEQAARTKRAAGSPAAGDARAHSPAVAPARPAPTEGGRKDGPPPLVPGVLAGLDRRSGEQLRKGRMPVEAQLDLHGMTQNAAHGAVRRFIETQHAAGRRCVLIVTGKGGRTEAAERFTFSAGRGVLREALPRWLNQPALRARIIAIQPASRAHGGEGAMYVLLKRKRT